MVFLTRLGETGAGLVPVPVLYIRIYVPHLASQRASYVTSATIAADGGRTAI